MAQTRFRIDEQMALSSTPRSILITNAVNKPEYFAPTTGADTIFFWDDSSSNWSQLTLGTNLSISGTTLNASSGGYATIQEEGTPLTARTILNFIGSGITAADNVGNTRTDVSLATILNNIATTGSVDLTSHVSGDLPFTNIAQLAGLSVLGNSTNALADMAAITAVNDHEVLRRSGTTIGFGAVDLSQSAAVTGVLDETNGGTGQSTYASGDILYANGVNTLAKRTIGASGTFLRVSGSAPIWSTAASTDLSDSANIAMLNENETVTGTWTFQNNVTVPATPTANTHATSKQYVDNLFQGVRDYKESVRVASIANVVVTYNSTGGTSATGQITAAPDTLNGVALQANDRILLKDQSSGAQNGIWVVTTVGTGANGVWDRATDFDSNSEVTSGVMCYVSEYSTEDNRGTYMLVTVDPIIVGTGSGTALEFIRITTALEPLTIYTGDGVIPNGENRTVTFGDNTTTLSFLSDSLATLIGIENDSVSFMDGSGYFEVDYASITTSVASLTFNNVSGLNLIITNLNAVITDDRGGAAQVGIEYDADYSANYTNRSLVDKEYVDNAVSASTTVVSEGFVESFSGTSVDLDSNDGTLKTRTGSNATMTIPTDSAKFKVFRNGQLIHQSGGAITRDYSVNTTTHVITFEVAVTSDEVIYFSKID